MDFYDCEANKYFCKDVWNVIEWHLFSRKPLNPCKVVKSGALYLFSEPFQTVIGINNVLDWTIWSESVTHGCLNVIKWLHNMGNEGCGEYVMDWAAFHGHLNIVKFLHENRKECSIWAMNYAAANGHLEIVKWLHCNRKEGCTSRAFDLSIANGHLEVVKWLLENRKEICSTCGMKTAKENGRLEIVKFLREKQHGCWWT